jgi:hypothetical protein
LRFLLATLFLSLAVSAVLRRWAARVEGTASVALRFLSAAHRLCHLLSKM